MRIRFKEGDLRGGCFNSACPWASSEQDLATLWANPFTSAITTRTATLAIGVDRRMRIRFKEGDLRGG
jgi:hypothetical protein